MNLVSESVTDDWKDLGLGCIKTPKNQVPYFVTLLIARLGIRY